MGSVGSVAHIVSNASPEAEKTLKQIIRKTQNLKNEQYRIIGENGEVLVEGKGDAHKVSVTVGQKREYMEGATSIHNHPAGGTFSDDDLRDFGFGARMIVVAGPNGEQYRLINDNYGTPRQTEGWLALQDALKRDVTSKMSDSPLYYMQTARKNLENSREYKEMQRLSEKWVKRRAEGASQEELQKYYDQYEKYSTIYKQKVKREQRRIEVRPAHEYLKKNAKKYGFTYSYKNPI